MFLFIYHFSFFQTFESAALDWHDWHFLTAIFAFSDSRYKIDLFPFSKDENVLNFSFDYYEKINVGFIIEGYSGNGKEVKHTNICQIMLVIRIKQVLRCYPPYCISDKVRLYRLHNLTHGGRGRGYTPPYKFFGRLYPLKLLAGWVPPMHLWQLSMYGRFKFRSVKSTRFWNI